MGLTMRPGAKNGGIPILAIATEQGTAHLINTSKRRDWDPEQPRTTLQVHQNGIFDIKWNSDDTLLATCSGDQSTHITCVTGEKVIYALRAHKSTVKCAAWDPTNAKLLSTGGRDGTICLWDLRVAGTNDEDGSTILKPVMTIPGAHEESMSKARRRSKKASASRSVTSILYPEIGTYGLVSSGSSDGVIKHWDLRSPARKGSVKPKSPTNLYSSIDDPTTLHSSRRPRGIIKLTPGIGASSGLIFGLGADSRVHVYDVLSLNPLPQWNYMQSSQYSSFAVVGAGYVGLPIIKALVQQKASVLVLTRSPPKSDLPEGVQVVQFRHTIASIAWALQQHCIEVVISTIDADDLPFQNSVAEVSKGAGVKLFLPSDFGMPIGGQDSFIAMDKSASQTDFFMELIPDLIGSRSNGKVNLLENIRGETPISFTSIDDVAGFVAYVLTKLDPVRLVYTSFKVEGQRASIVDIASILGTSIEQVSEVPSPQFPLASFFQEYFETTGSRRTIDRDPAQDKEGKEEKEGSSNYLWENHRWKIIREVLSR
ncbi:hypothetical protein C0993_010033 [Termitomyces sp. T159_Od127]|nr:hypothetical protein C0993_010033 [Termitomyces sp. T159_Od127]